MVPKFIRMGVLKVQCFQNNGVRGGSANLGYLYRCRVSAFLHVCQFEPRLFLKSHFKTFDQIEPAIFLLSKSQAQPPIKILYLFCYYTHSSCHLKTPFLVSLSLILHSEILFIISINPIIAEKDTPAVATNLERKNVAKRSYKQFPRLCYYFCTYTFILCKCSTILCRINFKCSTILVS